MPYLEEMPVHRNAEEIAQFMKGLGALTAVAYFLEMTDLHFDNVISWNCKPVIVDAECIFYSYLEYSRDSAEDRMANTGLVSAAPFLSSILGGKSSALSFGAQRSGGKIVYLSVEEGVEKNRLLDEFGKSINPANFSQIIADGFYDALCALCSVKQDLLLDVKAVSQGMKTRRLLRLTMQYAVTLEMLRNPKHASTVEKIGQIISIFSRAQSLSTVSCAETLRCEIVDLLDSDVPSFWMEDSNGMPHLMHWTGSVKKLKRQDSLAARIERSLNSCLEADAMKLREYLKDFVSGQERSVAK